MTAEIELVTRIQSLDTRSAALEKEVANFPKHIAHVEKALDGHLKKLEADRAAHIANQKTRKSLEDDNKVNEQKISKFRDQTLQAKNNEQYKAFQNEIAFAEKEIRKSEDRILELMGQSEALDTAVKHAESALKKEKQQVDSEKARARERTAADQKQLDAIQAERAELASQLAPQVLQLYERVRKKRKGIAIAEVVAGRCSACMILLRNQYLQDLRKSEQIMVCETCGCILYYNVPVSFEQDLAAARK